MKNRFEIDKAAVERAAQRKVNDAIYSNWLGKHPELTDCIANKKIFQEYLEWSDEITEEHLEFALGNLELQLAIQKVPTPEETKAALIEKILSLIASADGTGRDGKFDTHSLKLEKAKMAHWSIPQLTERLAEVVRKQDLNSKPIGELQQIVQSARKYVGYPQLGKTIVRHGTVRAVPLDAAYLHSLDAWELKKFCRLYGVEQINARLAGKE